MTDESERADIEFIDPVWLSHHRLGEEERCVVLGGRHVCRRCLWLWPLTGLVMALSLTVGLWPTDWDQLLLAVLPLPAVLEFVGEQRGRVSYDPRRQVLLVLPLAAALGRGLARYLDDQGDPVFWSMVVIYGALCAGAAVSRALNDAD